MMIRGLMIAELLKRESIRIEANMVINRYSYTELFEKAVRSDARQEDIENLAEWFWIYGASYWNGEYFGIDDCHVLRPIYGNDENGKTVIIKHEIN